MRGRHIFVAALLAVVAVVGGGSFADEAEGKNPKRQNVAAATLTDTQRPNVVVVMADDLDVATAERVGGLDAFAAGGADFSESFVTNSLCCPSRATFLRGQYSGNHGVTTNWAESYGAYPRFVREGHDRSNLVTRLNTAGYDTAMFGKYLNEYTPVEYGKPPGWDRFAFVNDSGEVWEDGVRKTTGEQFHDDYSIRRASEYIGGRAGTPAASRPFFMWLPLHSPHAPYEPPPRYRDYYSQFQLPASPGLSERDLSDKPRWVRNEGANSGLGTEERRRNIQALERDRLRETEVVSDALQRVGEALSAAGEYRETYVVFTSDNGYMLGEHGLPLYKMPPYEESIRVPLSVRGPGIPKGIVKRQMVTNNDLAPTILDWANAGIPEYTDGRTIAPLARGENPDTWRRSTLIEHWVDVRQPDATAVPYYEMVRTSGGEAFVRYSTGEKEYYDLAADPDELENGAADPANAERVAGLANRLDALKACAGSNCRGPESGPTVTNP